MLACLHGYWSQAERYQKFLYAVGALLVASAAFHFGVLLATGALAVVAAFGQVWRGLAAAATAP